MCTRADAKNAESVPAALACSLPRMLARNRGGLRNRRPAGVIPMDDCARPRVQIVVANLLTLFTQWLCPHSETVVLRKRGHICLLCLRCEHETTGWTLDQRPPVTKF